MPWALVIGGEVREVAHADPAGRFHSSLSWISCGDAVQPGWTYAAGQFAARPAPPAEPRYVPVATIRERMEAAGTWGAMAAILAGEPAAMLKVLTLRSGVAADDVAARAMIAAAGSDPDAILAP